MTDALADHFADLRQQRAAADLGIWVFLATEMLFFGALFVAFSVYAHGYPQAFAIAQRHTDLAFGAANSAILLTSSLTASLAVKAGDQGNRRWASILLLATIVLAFAFLIAKGFEYWSDIDKHLLPGHDFGLTPARTQMFWCFYWIMTAVHGIHITVGIGVLTTVVVLLRNAAFDPAKNATVQVSVLYWHFVDLVWIFLFPLLYLGSRT